MALRQARSIRAGLVLAAAILFPAGAGAEILIGVAGPMTGPFAMFGEEMKAGAEQAAAEINAAGGILGEPVVIELADDGCDPEKASAVANQMAGRGIRLMAGHLCSFASIPAARVYADAKIVQISPGSPNPKFTDERAGPGIFRLAGREDRQGPIAGAFLAARFPDRRIAVLDDRSTYGKGLADAVRKAMNDAGVKEVLNESYDPGAKDYSELVAKLRAAGIGTVFLGGYHAEAAIIVRQMRDQAMDAVLVAGDAIMTEEFWQTAGEAAEGSLMTFPPDPARDPANLALVETFRARGIEPEGFVIPTYAAIMLWKQAVETAGTLDFDKVVATLAGGTFTTPLGSVSFDEKGDARLPAYVVYRWHNGKYDYLPM